MSLRVRAVMSLSASLVTVSALLGACSFVPGVDDAPRSSEGSEAPAAEDTATGDASEEASEPPEAAPVRVLTNLPRKGQSVTLDTVVEFTAEGGTLRSVKVRGAGGLSGQIADDKAGWSATGRLESGASYVAQVVAENADGERQEKSFRFQAEDLPLDRQTYPSIAPLDGETVGIGMPVVVSFDIPVDNRKVFEQHMTVTSKPAQKGSWHWVSSQEAHWRPARYWKSGTDVTVDIDVNSLPAGDGVFGQESRQINFDIGSAMVSRVDAAAHTMKVFQNGQLLRTIPVTTGKPGFTTRSGTKVIMEMHRTKRMRSETTGISSGSEYYDIAGVEYAMRLTYSGEFVHAAPWSVGSQGYANVSHGCTGMSTENAGWLYSISKRGDVVEYTGTDRWMDLYNGYGDWNASFKDYRQRSALT